MMALTKACKSIIRFFIGGDHCCPTKPRSLGVGVCGTAMLSLIANAVAASPWELNLKASSYSYSKIAPVSQVFDNLEGPTVKSGDTAFTDNRIELKFQKGRFGVGLFSRYHYLLYFTPETADFIHAINNDIAIAPSSDYPIDLTAHHMAGEGMTFHFTQAINGFHFATSGSYIRAHRMTEGRLWGNLTTNENNEAGGDAYLAYSYSDDLFFKREKSTVKGYGFTLDASLAWQIHEGWTLSAAGKDLVSDVKWQDQHYTTAEASTKTIAYDNEGFINVSPILTWYETEKSLSQTFPRQTTIRLEHTLDQRNGLGLEYYQYDSLNFPRLTYTRKLSGSGIFSTHYDLESKAILLKYQNRHLSASYTADKLSPGEAFVLGFELTYSLAW